MYRLWPHLTTGTKLSVTYTSVAYLKRSEAEAIYAARHLDGPVVDPLGLAPKTMEVEAAPLSE
jgi:hypothetical protein